MRAFMYTSFLVFCSFVLVLGVIAMLLDWEPEDPQLIDPSDLARMQVGDVVRLGDLLKGPAEKVCFLTPYRDRLEETEPLSQRVNAHLEATSLRLQDGGFALVFVTGNKVSVQRLSGTRLNIATWHEGAGRILKPLGCSDVDRILATKVHDLWTTLVFGEKR